MKLKVALVFAGLFLSFQVFGQQQIQAYRFFCTSSNYAADSLESAVAKCAKYSARSEGNCNKGVSCRTYLTHCTAKGYSGSSVESAIAACTKYSASNERTCSRSVSCR